jgi:hypothetical protein
MTSPDQSPDASGGSWISSTDPMKQKRNKRNISAGVLPLKFSLLLIVAVNAWRTATLGQIATPRAAGQMQAYETKYYIVHTDVDPDEMKEACIRITKMAEEYHNRTSDFAGQIAQKLPFYLFKDADEYYASGGVPNSAGVFDGTRLMAIGDKRMGRQIWHVVQHEGFHQFLHAVIGGEIPVWVNEGMAEYFGEGIFTGDGFVTGVIPSGRRDRVVKTMALPAIEGGFKSMGAMMRLSHASWNQELNVKNYDQAWSMVQFLAHGEEGKYQPALGRYMGMVGRGQDPQEAWSQLFGNDAAAFDAQWRAYWKSLPASPTRELYARATVATLTSFLARAFDQRQAFASFDAFVAAAENGELKSSTAEWLPPSLLESTLRDVAVRRNNGQTFSLSPAVGMQLPELSCDLPEGLHLVGRFMLISGHVDKVIVSVSGEKRQ